MKIKRIKSLKVNAIDFKVIWNNKAQGATVDYRMEEIIIGTAGLKEPEIFMLVCHELMEICAIEMCVRLSRPDCEGDYIFVYDHRQHQTIMQMFSGLLREFL